MAGDRSGYRDLYPAVLTFSQGDAEERLEAWTPDLGSPIEFKRYLYGLAEDAGRVREGVSMAPWPDPEGRALALIHNVSGPLCIFRLCQVGRLKKAQRKLAGALKKIGIEKEAWAKQMSQFPAAFTEEQFAELETLSMDWKEIFITVPTRRLLAARGWRAPFDAVDGALSEENFPVPDEILGEMHDRINRGHNWFGVGEWNIANRQYLTALTRAIATNNLLAVEAIVRFLVDTYAAAGDCLSAVNLAQDYLNSAAYRKGPYARMTREMLETIVVAFSLSGQVDESRAWLRRIPRLCESSPSRNIYEWNIVELLNDTYEYRQDRRAMSGLRSAIVQVRSLL